ncbi:YdeI/OmpD-associated family protein [Sphingomonas sp. DT-51]
MDALAALPEAEAFFRTLDRKNLYPIYYRLQTAKRPETRARRMQQILEQLARGERFH